MSPPPPGMAGIFSFSGLSATMASVVRNSAGDRRGVLERRPRDLRGVHDPRLEHVHVLAGGRVQAPSRVERSDLLDDHAALEAGVRGDLLEGRLERLAHDQRAGRLVALQVELVEPRLAAQQRHAAAGHDALLDRGLGGLHRVLDAVLLLLQLDLGGRADLDHGDAAGQLGEPLLELLAVVVRVGLVDLALDLVDPALDVGLAAAALDERGLVLVDR